MESVLSNVIFKANPSNTMYIFKGYVQIASYSLNFFGRFCCFCKFSSYIHIKLTSFFPRSNTVHCSVCTGINRKAEFWELFLLVFLGFCEEMSADYMVERRCRLAALRPIHTVADVRTFFD